ncbi:hypothetical protein, partial [Enterobacter intestinihominis]
LEDLPWIPVSIQGVNIYTDPLNVIQGQLLHRSRQAEQHRKPPEPPLQHPQMVILKELTAFLIYSVVSCSRCCV